MSPTPSYRATGCENSSCSARRPTACPRRSPGARTALPLFGRGMSMRALTYLATQYQLALLHSRFLVLLATAGVAQPLIMIAVGAKLTALALGLLGLQRVLAAAMLSLDLRKREVVYPDAEEPTAAGVATEPVTPTAA